MNVPKFNRAPVTGEHYHYHGRLKLHTIIECFKTLACEHKTVFEEHVVASHHLWTCLCFLAGDTPGEVRVDNDDALPCSGIITSNSQTSSCLGVMHHSQYNSFLSVDQTILHLP
jgi:hypothetical protein